MELAKMNITRAALRQIIREQTDEDHAEKPEDVETVEDAWGGGENLAHDLDHSKISTGESNIATPEVLELVVAEVRKRLFEKKDQNKDGENDFDDVKIARMKASGMSDEEIKKKHPELFKELFALVFEEIHWGLLSWLGVGRWGFPTNSTY